MTNVILKPISSIRHHWAGNNGRIYLKLRSGTLKAYPIHINSNGRPFVYIKRTGRYAKLRGCTRKQHEVVPLIIRTFKSSSPFNRSYSLIKDGNPHNTVPDNLYWGSNEDCIADREFHESEGIGNIRPQVRDL